MALERSKRALVGAGVVVCAVVAGAGVAGAHIHPDPETAPAGSRLSVGLTVEHGCDGSPTVQLAVRVPDGSSDPVAEPPEGWTGSVDGDVVTFVGGPLPDDVELTVRVAVTLPLTPGATVYFPMVQTCEVGELRWIDVPTDGSGDTPDEPAPAMELTEPLPETTAPTTVAPTTVPETTVPETTAPAPEVPASEAPVTEVPATEAAPVDSAVPVIAPAPTDTAPGADGSGDDGDDSAPSAGLIVGIVAAVVVVALGAAVGLRRRR